MPLVREHEVSISAWAGCRWSATGRQAETLEALTSDARAITSDFSNQVTALSHAHRSNDLGPDTRAIAMLLEQLIARISKTERDLEELAGNIAGLRTRMEPGEANDRIDQLTGVTSRTGARAMVDGLANDLMAMSWRRAAGRSGGDQRALRALGRRQCAARLRRHAASGCEGAEIVRWQGNLFWSCCAGGRFDAGGA